MQAKLVKSILHLLTGSLAAQLITFAALPFITRLYGAQFYGEASTVIGIFGVLTPIATLTLAQAIPVSPTHQRARSLYRLSIHLSIALSLLAACLLTPLATYLNQWLNLNLAAIAWASIPLALLCAGYFQANYYLALREGRFRRLSLASLGQSLLGNAAKLATPLVLLTPLTLIFVTALQPLLQSFLIRDKAKAENPTRNQRYPLHLLHYYRQFPLFQTPQQLLNAAAQALPLVALAVLFSPLATAAYAVARVIIGIPTSLLNKAVGDVMYTVLGQSKPNQYWQLWLKTSLYSLALALVVLLVIVVFSESFIPWFLGDEWQLAATLAVLLSPWFASILVNPASVKLLIVMQRQHHLLYLNILTFTARLLCFVWPYWLTEPGINGEGTEALDVATLTLTVLTFSLVGLVHNLVVIIYAGVAAYSLRYVNASNVAR